MSETTPTPATAPIAQAPSAPAGPVERIDPAYPHVTAWDRTTFQVLAPAQGSDAAGNPAQSYDAAATAAARDAWLVDHPDPSAARA